ncbi:MAG TPA: hypothetical protein VFR67_26260 [Pilimelia sp.]|nr:hypothetical protein [Pilimelia sp.]
MTVTAPAPIRSAGPRAAARPTTMALLAVGFGVGYVAGGAPMVELKEPSFHALGDHFHPILALLTPAYRLFPHTETPR